MRALILGAFVAALVTTSAATAQQASPGMMHGNMGDMGMMHGTQHIEGRLAFLKTELKITDAQAPQWNAYADALRANAKRMPDLMAKMMPDGMMGQGIMSQDQGMGMGQAQNMNQGGMTKHHGASLPLPERLKLMEQHMSAHLEMMQAIKGPILELYGVLSKAQKEMADELLMGHMSMM